MFKDVLEFIWSIIKSRCFIMCLIFTFMFSILIVRVFNLQIANHDAYVNTYIAKTEKDITIPSARGLIYDRNGILLAYNELTYSVQITDILESSMYKNENMNDILHKTIKIIESNGDSIITDFPIVFDANGNPVYNSTLTASSRLRFLKNMYGTETLDTEKSRLSDTTAIDAYKYMKEKKYAISEELYEPDEILKIMTIRYNLSLNTYQKYIATTVATNVSEKTVAAIYENEKDIPGVVIDKDYVRKYNDSIYFAHIIGYTGKVSEEQIAEYATAGYEYTQNDSVGKTGIEASFETTLAGTKGSQRVQVDNLGKILNVVSTVDSKAGTDIYLTLDANLQKAAYHQVEQKLAGILVNYLVAGSLTEKQKENNYIPVNEAYTQIFNNNIVDIDKFSLDSASDNEKNIYNTFSDKKSEVRQVIHDALYDDEAKALKTLSEEWNDYYTYIFNKLSNTSIGLNIIDKSKIDSNDKTYKAWLNDETSLRAFLKYAVSMNWINISKIGITSTYSDGDVVYDTLVDYIMNSIDGDKSFDKIMYKYLISVGKIRGNQICMTLYDQAILPMNESAYSRLSKSTAYAYEFLIEQIKSLSITPAQLALNPCSGSVVVTNPNTADVLALVSYPSYDNNVFSGSINSEYWNKLTSDLSNPLFNRATKSRTAPGSTFKMLSAITGLEEKVINPSTTITTKGIYENDVLTNTPKCWYYPHSHGTINVVKAIEVSCNYFFYEVGYRLGLGNGTFSHDYGLSRLKKYATMFGLTEKSGVEIDEYMPLFSTSDTVMSSIGQGSHSYAPVQLVRYVGTIANGGYCYKLTLIDKYVDKDGKVTENVTAPVEKADVSDVTYNTVKQGMLQVINYNYAKIYRNCEFQVAGKSGTAQENLNEASHALFVAYAPFDDPQVAISTVIMNGNESSYSAELARNVLRYYFGYIPLDTILSGTADLPNTAASTGD